MLNALEVGTRVPIHRHLKTSETVVCLEGCLEWVFYEEMAGLDTGGPVHDGETAADETQFVETARFRVCPRDGVFGIQVPQGAWHSIEVHEASTIFEAKDGAYGAVIESGDCLSAWMWELNWCWVYRPLSGIGPLIGDDGEL